MICYTNCKNSTPFQIDAEDLELIDGVKVYKRKCNKKHYIDFPFCGKRFYLHRHILGAKKGEYVDHINGDTLDNRRCNLRICTSSQNNKNKKLPSKGCYFDKPNNKWRAEIWHQNKVMKLGRFKTFEEANRVYREKFAELAGEFAPAWVYQPYQLKNKGA